jgi:hypothetical protein
MSITTRGLIAHFDIKKSGLNDIQNTHSIELKGGVLQGSDKLTFDGSTGYARVSSSPLMTSNFHTVEVIFSSPFDGAEFTGINLEATMALLALTNTGLLMDKAGNVIGQGLAKLAKLEPNKKHSIVIVYEVVSGIRNDKIHLYVNGVKKQESTISSDRVDGQVAVSDFSIATSSPLQASQPFKGDIYSVKSYNVKLSDTEVYSNYQAEIIEQEEPISPDDDKAPTPEILSLSRNKISDEPTMDKAVLRFMFDIDVSQWSVNVNGASPTTGVVADLGGAVAKGTLITAEIDWTELQQEGQNRVNIYGKSLGGIWTPYEGETQPPTPTIVTDGLIGYWHYAEGVEGAVWKNIAPATKDNAEHNGSLKNGATLQSDGVYFDGVNDYASLGWWGHSYGDGFDNSSFTIELKVAIQSVTSNYDYMNIVSIGNYEDYFDINYTPADTIGFSKEVNPRVDEIAIVSVKEWVTITVVYNNTSGLWKYYKDGQDVSGSGINQKNPLRYSQMTITLASYNAERMVRASMKIKHFKLYNRVLDSEEIAQNFSMGDDVGLSDLGNVNGDIGNVGTNPIDPAT